MSDQYQDPLIWKGVQHRARVIRYRIDSYRMPQGVGVYTKCGSIERFIYAIRPDQWGADPEARKCKRCYKGGVDE